MASIVPSKFEYVSSIEDVIAGAMLIAADQNSVIARPSSFGKNDEPGEALPQGASPCKPGIDEADGMPHICMGHTGVGRPGIPVMPAAIPGKPGIVCDMGMPFMGILYMGRPVQA